MSKRPIPPVQKPPVRVNRTSFRGRVIMAVCGVCILLLALYVLEDKVFPAEITYKNVRGSGVPYSYQRERPGLG